MYEAANNRVSIFYLICIVSAVDGRAGWAQHHRNKMVFMVKLSAHNYWISEDVYFKFSDRFSTNVRWQGSGQVTINMTFERSINLGRFVRD